FLIKILLHKVKKINGMFIQKRIFALIKFYQKILYKNGF
ncbi:MAG: hypothetical protein ACJA1N_000749, partial [Saprospiraceae bacterium]